MRLVNIVTRFGCVSMYVHVCVREWSVFGQPGSTLHTLWQWERGWEWDAPGKVSRLNKTLWCSTTRKVIHPYSRKPHPHQMLHIPYILKQVIVLMCTYYIIPGWMVIAVRPVLWATEIQSLCIAREREGEILREKATVSVDLWIRQKLSSNSRSIEYKEEPGRERTGLASYFSCAPSV